MVDKNNVELVSYSQRPREEEQYNVLGNDEQLMELVAYCARVSAPDEREDDSKLAASAKLVKYLIKHKHWSPLEMVNVCLEFVTTRDIGRQILRHKSMSFQEFSQRYADPTLSDAIEFVTREARLQDTKNRQNSYPLDMSIPDHQQIAADWEWYQKQVISTSERAYNWAIKNGLAKECARVVLPEGNTQTLINVNASLRSWIHWIELRTGNGTQQEHINIAVECARVINERFAPIAGYVQGGLSEKTEES
jgi:thymidylate synthase (FAD)